MQQVHAEGSVRHAEKRRQGTCQFANRIARVSLAAYESSVPKSYQVMNKQTCVAAIVAHFRYEESSINQHGSNLGHLQVMGLGIGTKFLPDNILKEEKQQRNNASYGKRIRDCHAEVLARRAFRRCIALEMTSDLRGKKYKEETNYIPILERVQHQHANPTANDTRYRLRSDITLHFYTSSAPCGNATLKKFITMKKESFDASLVSFATFIVSCCCLPFAYLSLECMGGFRDQTNGLTISTILLQHILLD